MTSKKKQLSPCCGKKMKLEVVGASKYQNHFANVCMQCKKPFEITKQSDFSKFMMSDDTPEKREVILKAVKASNEAQRNTVIVARLFEKARNEFRQIGAGSVRFIATRGEVCDFWVNKIKEAFDCGVTEGWNKRQSEYEEDLIKRILK